MSLRFDYQSMRYYFICDKCEAYELLTSENCATSPKDWQTGSDNNLFKEGIRETVAQSGRRHEYEVDYHKFHFCPKCIRKAEVHEVFS